ncbi:MAG: MFS transporter, partial [Opitutaceae bacterium]|nr:MFS transporter [Opitutaceae bacterium]
MNPTILHRLPRNVWILAVCQALVMSAGSMLVLIGSLLATKIAPSPKLATLPQAALIVGTACATVPVAFWLRRIGRKRGSLLGYLFSLAAAGCGFFAAMRDSFALLVITGVCLGVAVAFWQQFRFAALESVDDPKLYGPTLSVMMGSGLLSAFLGPEIGARGSDWFPSLPAYAGSFILLGGVVLVSLALFQAYRETVMLKSATEEPPRPLRAIITSPRFFIPSLCAAIGFGVMSFVMTATPLTMHEVCGFDLDDTKRVIQGHIIAMFLPSVFSGLLMQRFGVGRVMTAGAALYALVVVIGLAGADLMHFWGSLLLLGIGWNFLFMGGTALLPQSYRPSERFRA